MNDEGHCFGGCFFSREVDVESALEFAIWLLEIDLQWWTGFERVSFGVEVLFRVSWKGWKDISVEEYGCGDWARRGTGMPI